MAAIQMAGTTLVAIDPHFVSAEGTVNFYGDIFRVSAPAVSLDRAAVTLRRVLRHHGIKGKLIGNVTFWGTTIESEFALLGPIPFTGGFVTREPSADDDYVWEKEFSEHLITDALNHSCLRPATLWVARLSVFASVSPQKLVALKKYVKRNYNPLTRILRRK